MDEHARTPENLAERERRASHALAAYQERRRRRRAEDTYFGSAECLLEHVERGIAEPERARRLSEIVAEAEVDGMSRDLAERLYEVAREEGIDPALGFELVRSGLGIVPPPDGVSNAPEQPVADRFLPEWMFPATPPDELLRERMLRFSFRRLKSLLEQYEQPADALQAFAREPDVGTFGY